MTNNDGRKRTLGLAEGFSAGLKFSLFFLLSFVFLGYSVLLSIFLAVIGGFAGAWVVAWSKSKDVVSQPVQTETAEENSRESRFNRAKKKKYSRQKSRPLVVPPLGWFFRRTQNSSKSRRRK